MISYLASEIYRILHKRSLYVYLGSLALSYIAIFIIRSGTFGQGAIHGDFSIIFSLFSAIVGGYFFAALYTDDLTSRNLTTLVGYGLGKLQIIIAKFILMLLFGALACFGVAMLIYFAFAVAGWPASIDEVGVLAVTATQGLLTTLAYSAIASIVVYGLQRTTFALVCYLLFALGIVDNLLSMVINMEAVSALLPDLGTHLLSKVVDRITIGMLTPEAPLFAPFAEYLTYLLLSLIVAAIAFKYKEMEF